MADSSYRPYVVADLSPDQLGAIVAAAPVAIYTVNRDDHTTSWNAGAEALFGWTEAEVLGRPLPIVPSDARAEREELRRRVLGGESISGLELRGLTRTGALIDVSLTLAPLRADDGTIVGVIAVAQDIGERKLAEKLDITERKQAERGLRDSEERYRAVVSALEEGVLVMSRDRRLVACNAAATRILGRSSENIEAMLLGSARCGVREDGTPIVPEELPLMRTMATGIADSMLALTIERPDGTRVWISMSSRPLQHPGGEAPFAAAAALADITERREADARLQHQAFHDALTGLPNRALFVDRLTQAIASASRRGDGLAVACIDVDRFKIVNDTLGHDSGDGLLCDIARRLTASARESDTVARMGGDEFMVILPGIREPSQAAAAARRMLDALRPAFEVEGHELRVSASIGLTVYPCDGKDAGTLMRNADRAMYRAKEAGKSDFRLFAPDADSGLPSRLLFESRLHRAIERGELRVEYQPQIDLATGAQVALEALLRWSNRELGLVMPEKIIPIAEENGMIVALGEWVLGEACRQMVRWSDSGWTGCRVAVNVSQVQFHRGDFVATVRRALETSGLSPHLLELELTESLVMRDADLVIERISALRRLGVSIALDDFGIGYSSLSYLRRLPIDTLKIDRSFVRDLDDTHHGHTAPIVQPVIALAHGLGMTVVAEGVETETQLLRLRQLRCDRAQGYAIAPPRAASETVPVLIARAR